MVDLEYLKELHEEHSSCSLAPKKKIIGKELMLGNQKRLFKDLELNQPNIEKLVMTLEDKNIT